MVAVYEDDEKYFGDVDTQPELYEPEDRDQIEFGKFTGFEKSVIKFKETLKNFKGSDNHSLTLSFMVLCFIFLMQK